MRQIVIGKSGSRNVSLDLSILLKSRALIQAGSGGGKSWLLRRLAEQLFGKVQVLIIDREGEFASLREKYGFVLAGDDGDTPADVRSARLLAEKLLELRASAVCDLYDAFRKDPNARRNWVRGFLEGIMDAPKKFWRDLVVFVDEAHVFAPEQLPKAGNQVDRAIISGCKDAMVSLATAGRKRGFCAVWATQRLAKLDKDASAELLNRFVGQTIEDVDVDRAADLMSVSRNEKTGFKRAIKNLDPGFFFGFGRAVSKDRTLIRVGPVKTTHPESGSSKHAAGPPPAPEKIRGLLPKLKDLPAEAEHKAKTEAELRKEIQSLKKQLSKGPQTPVGVKPKVVEVPLKEKIVEVPVVKAREIRQLKKLIKGLEAVANKFSRVGDLGRDIASVNKTLSEKLTEVAEGGRRRPSPHRCPTGAPGVAGKPGVPAPKSSRPTPTQGASPLRDTDLLRGERRMLEVLAQFSPGSRTRSQLGALTGLTPSGGTFNNYFGRLRKQGLIKEQVDGSVTITQAGLDLFGDRLPSGPQTTEELVEMWRRKLLRGEREMLDALIECYPESMTREELGNASGKSHTGGTFGNYLGTLRRNQLVDVNGDVVRASDALFDLAETVRS